MADFVMGLACYLLAGVLVWLIGIRRHASLGNSLGPSAAAMPALVMFWPFVLAFVALDAIGDKVSDFAYWYGDYAKRGRDA
jgi:hypothetical protein